MNPTFIVTWGFVRTNSKLFGNNLNGRVWSMVLTIVISISVKHSMDFSIGPLKECVGWYMIFLKVLLLACNSVPLSAAISGQSFKNTSRSPRPFCLGPPRRPTAALWDPLSGTKCPPFTAHGRYGHQNRISLLFWI